MRAAVPVAIVVGLREQMTVFDPIARPGGAPMTPLRSLPAVSLALLTASLALGPPALAKSDNRVGLEAEGLLVKDKVIAGVSGYVFFNEMIGIDGAFQLMFLDEESRRLDGTFLGGLLSAHLVFGFPVGDQAMIRVGTGVDYYGLWGIDDEESKLAMPLLVEARVYLTENLSAFIQPRYYLFSSDGLEPGVALDGDESTPLVISVGVGGEWR